VWSKKSSLYDAFTNNLDAHKLMASVMHGISYSDVTKEQRKVTKSITFGKQIKAYAEVKSAQLLETQVGNQQPEGVGTLSNGSETHSIASSVMVWEVRAKVLA
jgi:hypothetical protein